MFCRATWAILAPWVFGMCRETPKLASRRGRAFHCRAPGPGGLEKAPSLSLCRPFPKKVSPDAEEEAPGWKGPRRPFVASPGATLISGCNASSGGMRVGGVESSPHLSRPLSDPLAGGEWTLASDSTLSCVGAEAAAAGPLSLQTGPSAGVLFSPGAFPGEAAPGWGRPSQGARRGGRQPHQPTAILTQDCCGGCRGFAHPSVSGLLVCPAPSCGHRTAVTANTATGRQRAVWHQLCPP